MARKSKDAKVALLKTVGLFAGCSRRDLAHVASIADEVDVPAGTVLTRHGAPGREFFVIVDGEVVVTMPNGGKVWLKAGSFFGEMALLDGGPRVATVTAATDTRLLVLDRRSFNRLLEDVPSVNRKVLVELARRLRAVETTFTH